MLILHNNIRCDTSSELSHRDGSDEGSQHMVSVRNKKNYPSVIIKYSLLSRAVTALLTTSILRALEKREYLMIIRDNFY